MLQQVTRQVTKNIYLIILYCVPTVKCEYSLLWPSAWRIAVTLNCQTVALDFNICSWSELCKYKVVHETCLCFLQTHILAYHIYCTTLIQLSSIINVLYIGINSSLCVVTSTLEISLISSFLNGAIVHRNIKAIMHTIFNELAQITSYAASGW